MTFYIAQGVSVLTTPVAIRMMQCKNMKWLLAGQITANLLTVLSYLLLDGITARASVSLPSCNPPSCFFTRGRKRRFTAP